MSKRNGPPAYECAYCGKVAPATDDHIPPVCLYVPPLPATLPTVKACAACNAGASKDDEYFRDVVLKYHRVAEQPRAQPLVERMVRAASLRAKRRYTEATLASFQDVELWSEGGIFLGKGLAYRVEGDRVANAVERYVRGLYRFERKHAVPVGYEVRVVIQPELLLSRAQRLSEFLQRGEVRTVQPGVFSYAWIEAADRPDFSVWLLEFFDAFPVMGFVAPAALHAKRASQSAV